MGQFRFWAVCLTVVFALHIALSRRKSPDQDFGFFDCLRYQYCTCGNISTFNGCVFRLKAESRQKLVDLLNDCKLGSCTFYLEMTEEMGSDCFCGLPIEKWRECHKNVSDEFMKYMQRVSLNPFKADVSAAIERGRLCISPSVAGCQVGVC